MASKQHPMLNEGNQFKFTDAIQVLLPLQRPYATLYGERIGFFMADAINAIGGFSEASSMLLSLLADGLVVCEFVDLQDGESWSPLFRFANISLPTIH